MDDVSTEAPLASLIQISEKGRETFSHAARKTGDGLKVLFTALSQQHQQFAEDLATLNGARPEGYQVTTRIESQGPGQTRPDFGDGSADTDEAAIVNECVQTECEAVQKYETTLLLAELPVLAAQVVRRQLDSLKVARSYLRGLCHPAYPTR